MAGAGFRSEKDRQQLSQLLLLGDIERYDMVAMADTYEGQARPDRLADVRATVLKHLIDEKMTSGEAATLRGRLIHLGQCKPGRTGRSTLSALNEACMADGKVAWSD